MSRRDYDQRYSRNQRGYIREENNRGNYQTRGYPRCKIHTNSTHSVGECWIRCGYCKRTGSHLTNQCAVKDVRVQEFIEQKTRKYGLGARPLARSLVTERGIQDMSEETFERILKGDQVRYNNRSYENYQRTERERR